MNWLLDKLKGRGKETEPASKESAPKSKRSKKPKSSGRTIISPEAHIQLNRELIAETLAVIETGKELVDHSEDPREVERGRWILGFNYRSLVANSFVIGQIKWRLDLGDPTADLEAAVRYYGLMFRDCERYQAEVDTYWSHLVSFVCVILSGSIPSWVLQTLPDQSEFENSKGRLKPYEINLGYQWALASALHEGRLPASWPRFLSDSNERAGLKRIRESIVTYERLFSAARQRDWEQLLLAIEEADSNYRKRGSGEASCADVFGDGPYNGRSIDYITAAILRTVQDHPEFPRDRVTTPNIWKYVARDLQHLAPKGADESAPQPKE